MNDLTIEQARVAQYGFEMKINAGVDVVWRKLTDELANWWLPDFHMLGPDSKVVFEPFAGGRLYEENGSRSLLWYQVLHIEPKSSLSLSGFCTPEWGGPCSTLLTIKVTSDGETSIVKIDDALFGRVSEKLVSSLSSGWRQLFEVGLKAFVEAG